MLLPFNYSYQLSTRVINYINMSCKEKKNVRWFCKLLSVNCPFSSIQVEKVEGLFVLPFYIVVYI